MGEKIQVNLLLDKNVHKALKRRAIDEDKRIRSLANEILIKALGVEEEKDGEDTQHQA